MGKAARAKGARFERLLCALISERWNLPGLRRGLQFQGAVVPDVGTEKWWIECKVGKSPPIRPALEQAIRDTDGRIPVAIVKLDRCEPLVVMRLKDWLPMAERVEADGEI